MLAGYVVIRGVEGARVPAGVLVNLESSTMFADQFIVAARSEVKS
jgi:hypothetical protein